MDDWCQYRDRTRTVFMNARMHACAAPSSSPRFLELNLVAYLVAW